MVVGAPYITWEGGGGAIKQFITFLYGGLHIHACHYLLKDGMTVA